MQIYFSHDNYLSSFNDVSQLSFVRTVEVAMNLTEFSKHLPSDFFLELIHRHEVVVSALNFTWSGCPCCVTNAQLKDVWVASKQLCYDSSLHFSH
jgi:hypothetical protein